ncbi:MD-2-related lipid-recognition protein ROSY1-like [Eutrema salsugineum]|uniref:MD-2-related lipid-recognition protein ROSY1-like n=1 Tax=Eutrema salsugineum TaxID=72664 RepID=UPI000CED2414|nr:MD-2-related lipid-recognition protein ROSY1-like [Eutrema salsugineum]
MAISQAPPLLLLLLVSLFFFPALGGLTRFGNCSSTQSARANSVDISPNPVKRSGNANFTITGYTRKAIPGEASVELIFVTDLYTMTKNYSLCDITACPVSPGPFVLTIRNVFRTRLQKRVPQYRVGLRIMEKTVKEPIMCIGFYCKFSGSVLELSQAFTW